MLARKIGLSRLNRFQSQFKLVDFLVQGGENDLSQVRHPVPFVTMVEKSVVHLSVAFPVIEKLNHLGFLWVEA
jgi:hypothetical protein